MKRVSDGGFGNAIAALKSTRSPDVESMPINNLAGNSGEQNHSPAAHRKDGSRVGPTDRATSARPSVSFISPGLLVLVLPRSVLVRTVRRLRHRFWHALLAAMFAALILHAFKVIFSGHGSRTFVAVGIRFARW